MKKFNKKGLVIGIGTILFIIVALISFVVGCYLVGWDIFSWFISPTAYFVYGLLAIILIVLIYLYVIKRNNE